jgi:hypothetical protein
MARRVDGTNSKLKTLIFATQLVEIESRPKTDWNLQRSTSFVDLPVELRLLIYEYLIPNNMIISYDFHRSGIVQYHRHDQQPCSPAMLRVNRQIYDELIEMWYETAEFHISTVGRKLYFLGDAIATGDATLPLNLRLIRSLGIRLQLDSPRSAEPESYNLPRPWMRVITDCLAAGPNRLSKISLSGVTFTHPGRVSQLEFRHTSREIESVLKWNLGVIRMIRGAHLGFDDVHPFSPRKGEAFRRMVAESGQTLPTVTRTLARMECVRAKFLTILAEDMLKNTGEA